ncbi:MAG: hypothetical protein K6E42_09465 [Synergistes sp.]|nr:hypothetical protein [Synergistes sp.]
MEELEKTSCADGVKYAAYGHVGDGNMHVTLYLEEENENWRWMIEKARAICTEQSSGLGAL